MPGKSSDDRDRGDSGSAGLRRSSGPRLAIESRAWLRELYAGQRDRMVRMAERALPAGERVDAEDLVQTVFTEAARRCASSPTFSPGDGWVWQRLRSRIADLHRRRYRDRRAGLEPLADPERLLLGWEPVAPPDEQAVERLAIEELLEAIADPADRAALALRLRGLREVEIAQLLNVDPRSRQVRDRLARARQQAAERLRAERLETERAAGGRALDGPAA